MKGFNSSFIPFSFFVLHGVCKLLIHLIYLKFKIFESSSWMHRVAAYFLFQISKIEQNKQHLKNIYT